MPDDSAFAVDCYEMTAARAIIKPAPALAAWSLSPKRAARWRCS